jgi:hypothetical protein
VHVAAIGHKAFADTEPIGRDAIFRMASVSKPIAGVAAMLLTQRMMTSPEPTELARDFWAAAYAAIDD